MALRLILMGAVVGLGLTLPTRHQLGAWGSQAQHWVSARLADLDSRTPIDEDSYVVAYAPAPVAAPDPVVDPEPAAEPTIDSAPVVDADPEQVPPPVAAPTSERDVVLDEVLEKMARDAEAPATNEADANIEAAPPVEAVAVSELPSGSPVTLPVPTEEAASDAADKAFEVAMTEMAANFAEDLTASREREEADRAFGAVVEEMASTFATDPVVVALSRESAGPASEIDAYAFGTDLEFELGMDLGQKVDETDQPDPPVTAAPGDRWTHAVHLTREAVFAWASLLHGAAVVTIPR